MTRILIVQGHPDTEHSHLCNALADAYAEGANATGHEVRRIHVGRLKFGLLRNGTAFKNEAPPPDITQAQRDLVWANHLVLIYPLWLGTMPAYLKGFFEQLLRPDFAFRYEEGGRTRPHLSGRSARIVLTMGMPALVYRWFFRAHSLKSLERNILRFVGIGPIRETLFGRVEQVSDARRLGWIERMRTLGRRAG